MDPEPTPPVTDDLQRLAAWHARRTGEPVAVLLGDDGVCAFAENRLVVNGDDFDGLPDEVRVGMTFEPLPDPEPPEGIDRARMRAVPSAPRVGTLHLDGTSVPLD